MSKETDRQVSKAARKAAGVFYTPDHIVSYILERTLSTHDIVKNPAPRVLDPACGSGNFLVAAYDLLMGMFIEKLAVLRQNYAKHHYTIKNGQREVVIDGAAYWCQENLHYHIIGNCLYGADVDAEAVSIAAARLTGTNQSRLTPNLVVGDSLLKWEDSTAQSWGREIDPGLRQKLADFWSRSYDFIVGNPPYVSFGLNRVAKIAGAQSDYLRVNYPHSAQYKLSYYAMFIERSILALKPGGYLGFITPDSYLLGRYYSKIRQYILETCKIEELTLAASSVFSGVLVGIPAITILRKKDRTRPSEMAAIRVNKLNDAGEITATYQYNQNYFESQVYKRFRLFFNARDKAIIDEMERAPYRFGDCTKIRTGMRSLTVQANIKSKERQGDSWKRGLTSSSQVLPFGLVYQGDWLDVNPAKLNKGGWNAMVMNGSKIFMRQTGDSLIAAVDRSGLYHLNNIHSVTVLSEAISLEYLACILNSKLMNFYYHTITLEKGRSMAQVDIETVEKLPLFIDYKRASVLLRLGSELANLVSRLYSFERKQARSKEFLTRIDSIYNEVNQVVYEIYGLPDNDISYIEKSMGTNLERFRKGNKPRGRY